MLEKAIQLKTSKFFQKTLICVFILVMTLFILIPQDVLAVGYIIPKDNDGWLRLDCSEQNGYTPKVNYGYNQNQQIDPFYISQGIINDLLPQIETKYIGKEGGNYKYEIIVKNSSNVDGLLDGKGPIRFDFRTCQENMKRNGCFTGKFVYTNQFNGKVYVGVPTVNITSRGLVDFGVPEINKTMNWKSGTLLAPPNSYEKIIVNIPQDKLTAYFTDNKDKDEAIIDVTPQYIFPAPQFPKMVMTQVKGGWKDCYSYDDQKKFFDEVVRSFNRDRVFTNETPTLVIKKDGTKDELATECTELQKKLLDKINIQTENAKAQEQIYANGDGLADKNELDKNVKDRWEEVKKLDAELIAYDKKCGESNSLNTAYNGLIRALKNMGDTLSDKGHEIGAWLNTQIGEIEEKGFLGYVADKALDLLSPATTDCEKKCREDLGTKVVELYFCRAACWISEAFAGLVNFGLEMFKGALSTESDTEYVPFKNVKIQVGSGDASGAGSGTGTTGNAGTNSGSFGVPLDDGHTDDGNRSGNTPSRDRTSGPRTTSGGSSNTGPVDIPAP